MVSLHAAFALLPRHVVFGDEPATSQASGVAPKTDFSQLPANQSPAAQTQPAAEKQEQKYTPEQQQQLDRANDLLVQVRKLNDQGKYAEAIPLAAKALKLREAVLGPEGRMIQK
ncbi:MAG TPA: tetratricopeptide repeat protein [Pirellulales bacterium]|jgi:hypothetical protein|nr:tetratricopeptide repeat protein [Pirellulales bacterium]